MLDSNFESLAVFLSGRLGPEPAALWSSEEPRLQVLGLQSQTGCQIRCDLVFLPEREQKSFSGPSCSGKRADRRLLLNFLKEAILLQPLTEPR